MLQSQQECFTEIERLLWSLFKSGNFGPDGFAETIFKTEASFLLDYL